MKSSAAKRGRAGVAESDSAVSLTEAGPRGGRGNDNMVKRE